ncbi:MAG: hypothetical protein ACRDJ9_17510 [Dehalococcoidia bacterium]
MDIVDRELRDWLRSLAVRPDEAGRASRRRELSEQDAAYLARIATDGTLAAAVAEIGATDSDLAD